MKRFANRTVVGVALGLMIIGSGCEKAQETPNLTFADLKPNDVVVTVNGSPIFWADLCNQLDFENQVRYCGGKAKHPDANDKLYIEYRTTRLRQNLIGDLVNSKLFELACKDEGIEAGAETVRGEERSFVGAYAMKLKLGTEATVEDVAEGLSVDANYVKRLLRQDANRKAYIWTHEPLSTNITEEVLADAKQRVLEFNLRADASNAVQRAKLDLAKSRILKGEDFVKIGTEFGEIRPNEAKSWDSFFWGDFKPKDRKLRDWSFSAKIGDVFGPYDNAEGLSLYKLISRHEGAKEASAVAKSLAKVVLVRITVKAYDKIPITSDDKMRDRMMGGYYHGAYRDALNKFHESMRIYYPNGTNLWARLPECLRNPPKPLK